jgi:2-polyprenyl-3-methyl-5-hydroxy-6-metoxy-1,4-benzoquinol methylase
MTKCYQYGLSEVHSDSLYDVEAREQKTKKMLAVLDDYYSGKLEEFSLLDVGCSTGIIAKTLRQRVARVVGVDIDAPALKFAQTNSDADKLHFSLQDGLSLGFPDGLFDVVICAHTYEHVPDSRILFSEIHRVLKIGGVCYFAAGNRFMFMEPHYKLPLLSVIPKPLAHIYLRSLKKGSFYYEELLTFWELRKLVSRFEVIDYTSRIVHNPQKYYATDMIKQRSLKQVMAKWVLIVAYWLFPSYIWLLRK